jgi:hypothetical protein
VPGFGGVPDEQLVRYSSTITIEELTAAGEGSPRKLVLRGPSMPFQGADWGGKNTLITTFYPGNTIGTQQDLGPQEMPSAWTGEWNRTLLGKSPVLYTDETGAEIAVINPWSLWDIFEDVFRKGAALRVTWSTHGVESVGDVDPTLKVVNWDVVRDGRCAEWKYTPDRHVDVKWSFQFQWYGRGGEANRTASAKEDNDLAAAANGLENAMAFTKYLSKLRAAQIKDGIRLSSHHLTLGQLEAIADAPNKLLTQYTRKLQAAVNDVKRVGNIVKKFRAMPYQLANTVTDFARNTTAIANQFVDEMGRTPPELLTNKRKVSDLMRAYTHFARQTEQSAINARRGREIEDRTRRFIAATPGAARVTVRESAAMRVGSIIGTYITKTGDTPQTVSKRFYNGSIDGALGILQANRLPWHTPTFERGKILIIPVLAGAHRQ